MPYVACPSCGERGKISESLLGSRIKCKKCGLSFHVAPPVARASASPGPTAEAAAATAVGATHEGIEVEGLDAAAWTAPSATADRLSAEPEVDHPSDETSD